MAELSKILYIFKNDYVILDLKVLSDQLDEDDDGYVSQFDIERVLKMYNVNDSSDAAKFLIEEADARGINEYKMYFHYSRKWLPLGFSCSIT